jgi:hypothetical protein
VRQDTAGVAGGHRPDREQRRRAVVTAVVLAVMVLGIYATVVLRFAL